MTTATNPSLRRLLVFIVFTLYKVMFLGHTSPSLAHVSRQHLWKRLQQHVHRQDQKTRGDSSSSPSKPRTMAKKFVPFPRKRDSSLKSSDPSKTSFPWRDRGKNETRRVDLVKQNHGSPFFIRHFLTTCRSSHKKNLKT